MYVAVQKQKLCKIIIGKTVDMLRYIVEDKRVFVSQFVNDKEKPSLVALRYGADCFSKDRELI